VNESLGTVVPLRTGFRVGDGDFTRVSGGGFTLRLLEGESAVLHQG
jgi:hypothetical protein